MCERESETECLRARVCVRKGERVCMYVCVCLCV